MTEQEMKAKEDEYVNNNPDSLRKKNILVIESIEKLNVSEDHDGIELNEGYEYSVNGALPEIADGIAKMALTMDNDEAFGEGSGKYFLHLICEYYERLKGGKE